MKYPPTPPYLFCQFFCSLVSHFRFHWCLCTRIPWFCVALVGIMLDEIVLFHTCEMTGLFIPVRWPGCSIRYLRDYLDVLFLREDGDYVQYMRDDLDVSYLCLDRDHVPYRAWWQECSILAQRKECSMTGGSIVRRLVTVVSSLESV